VSRSRVSTHVLDAVSGRPAVGVPAQLHRGTPEGWFDVAGATTDEDGRIADLGPVDLDPGTYRITFETGTYFRRTNTKTFYPEVALTFEIDDPEGHYHVPLLLSPYAYSTYRGS
jgi:5-hydroxyisourate hydrolase